MNRKHKKHRSLSPPDEDDHRKSKNVKRHHNESSSDEEDHRKNSHKHQKHRHHSNDEEDKKLTRAHRRKESHQRGRDAKFDPNLRIKQEKDDENFQQQQRERSRNDADRRVKRRDRERNDGDFGLNTAQVKSEEGEEEKKEDKQKPNFKLSGKLTEDTNTFRGVVIKYNEPPEAMKPKRRWRLYPFKGEEALPVLHIHRQSAYLLGRDRKIADIPVDHPSCSKQQAVLQFRAMPYTRPDGTPGRRVRPYIIDLESSNGTYLNNEKIEPRRYYELREKDVIKFGFSTREYVVLHDSVDLSEVTAGDDMEEV
ncbi:unnamed protein product [Lymnaea stagnalis]|uniref:FHA domain-containing protein n=1 Tax=Lymnaea stagnalis TaxID=6523 RepID=A0AAV2HED5_LYMST